jgi:hypothetical protein
MGYKSVLRSVGAAIRQAEREAIRRQRELEKQRAAYEKMEALEQAAYDVEVYENYIDRIRSLHKDCLSNYCWKDIIKKRPPSAPKKAVAREIEARSKIENFKPSFIDKLFSLEGKKRQKLEQNLSKSISEDENEYEQLSEKYKNALKEYNELMDMAKNILQGDTSTYRRAIEELEPLSEISEIGSDLSFNFISKDKISIVMTAHDTEIVPEKSKSLLKSGKISIKELPAGKYNEIYQDYVCSASLRVAREIFGLLPVDEIIVTTKSKLLNKATGRLDEQPLLSVRFIRETMNTLNYPNIDPSDSMTNFIHNMGFKKSQGMSSIEELTFT